MHYCRKLRLKSCNIGNFIVSTKILRVGGPWWGQVISVLVLYFGDPSLNPAESQQSSSLKFEFEKNENKQKEARFGPFKKLLSGNLRS